MEKKQLSKKFVRLIMVFICMFMLSVNMTGNAFAKDKLGEPVPEITVRCVVPAMNPNILNTVKAVAKTCKETIGLELKPLPSQYPEIIQKVIIEKDFSAWCEPFGGTEWRLDPQFFLYKLHYTKGGMNVFGFSDPKVDELCELQFREMDPKKRKEYIFELQKEVHAGQAVNVLLYPKAGYAFRTDFIDPDSLVPTVGEGPTSFWSEINLKPLKGNGYTVAGNNIGIPHLSPIKSNGIVENQVLRLIYDSLFRIGPDQMPRPWAAKSYEVVNSTTINVTIRDGMTFHDGKPVRTEDVKFTFDYIKKVKAPFWIGDMANVESVTITGKNTVQFKLKEPNSTFFSMLLSTVYILPEHIWKDLVEREGLKDPLEYNNPKPIGSGPFKFDYWEREAELKLTRFDDYFQPAKAKGIIRVKYGSADAVVGALETGACHRTWKAVESASAFENIKKLKNVDARFYDSHMIFMFMYNCARPPFDDKALRMAMAHVLPKKFIRDAIHRGNGTIGSSVIAPVNKAWNNPDIKPFPEDVNKAKQILKEAGYGWDKKGRLHYPVK